MADFPTAKTNAVDNVTDVLAKHINNLENKVGIDSSTDTGSLDYKVHTLQSALPSGAIVGTTDTQTLTNKTIDVGDNTLSGLLDWFYPVGTIYETTSTDLDTTTKMNAHFGGTWEVYGAGRVLVAKSADTEFDTIGETGGVKTVTLTAAQSGLVGHNHTQNAHGHAVWSYSVASGGIWMQVATGTNNSSAGGTNGSQYLGLAADTTATNNAVASADASSAHTNLQPYIVVYRYRRTA